MSITSERLKELDDKVREVGTFLGMQFDEEYAQKHERDWNYWSQLKNGNKVISFHTGDYKFSDRWMIHADFPKDNRGQILTTYNAKRPEITVTMAKTPEKIAQDIKSRLLPQYERQLAEVLIRIERSNKYHADRLAQISKVAEFLGLVKTDLREDSAIFPKGQRGVYKIEPSSEDSVKFEITISAEKAIEILKILGY